MANDNVIYKARGAYPFNEGSAVVLSGGKDLNVGRNVLDRGEHPTDTIQASRDKWGAIFLPAHAIFTTGSAMPSGTFTVVYNA